MSKWQEKWDKEQQQVVSFEVGEKVWWGHYNTPGIIRGIREDEEPGSVRKYIVQLPTVTQNTSCDLLKKVKEEDL